VRGSTRTSAANGGDSMDSNVEDSFVVYLRRDRAHDETPEEVERPIATFATYGEARRRLREIQHSARQGVIRFVGQVGGGD
jgi:hypothetical protein